MGLALKSPGKWGFYRFVPEPIPRTLSLDSDTILALSATYERYRTASLPSTLG
jgi:hypothetical protein